MIRRYLLLVLLIGQTTLRAVQIVREDSENPVVSVATSTFYGALAGSVVGVAIMLVSSGNDGDIFKWSFFSGTVVGMGAGIYHVVTRPAGGGSNALLHIENGKLQNVSVPLPSLTVRDKEIKGVEVPILAVTF